MLFIDTTYRSKETEIMDDFSMKGPVLRDTLDKLAVINKWLGGNAVTRNGLKTLLKDYPKNRVYTLVDLGCGHGDMLRLIADFGRQHGYDFKLIGIDANADSINYAEELSMQYPEISYQLMDVFSDIFYELEYDIAISTLFIHHFEEKEILWLLQHLSKRSQVGIVVNDLHRSRLAYALFKFIGLFISNPMIVKDGLTSILRAFKREDLESISQRLQLNSQIRWKWAFRYQWIIRN